MFYFTMVKMQRNWVEGRKNYPDFVHLIAIGSNLDGISGASVLVESHKISNFQEFFP